MKIRLRYFFIWTCTVMSYRLKGFQERDKTAARRWAGTEKHLQEFGQAVVGRRGSTPQRTAWLGTVHKLSRSKAATFCLPQNSKPRILRPGKLCTGLSHFHGSIPRKCCHSPTHAGLAGRTAPSAHTHCQPARCWTEAVGEDDQETNFHSDSC